MICFHIEVNGEKVCTAGVGEFGVLTAVLSWVRNRQQHAEGGGNPPVVLHVGGLTDQGEDDEEHVQWARKDLAVGDVVRVEIVDAESCDEPGEKKRQDPAQRVERAREYYEQLKAGLTSTQEQHGEPGG